MSEPARAFEREQTALDARIDGILSAHRGSWRAAMEALLMAYDEMETASSRGFVRNRFWNDG
jgi:hypothetical protein